MLTILEDMQRKEIMKELLMLVRELNYKKCISKTNDKLSAQTWICIHIFKKYE